MCQTTISPAAPSGDGGFCLDVQAQKLSDNLYPGLWEVEHRNPGSNSWTTHHSRSVALGTIGEGKGRICYSPLWTFHTLFDGIQSGATVRVRSVNQPLPKYGEPDFGTTEQIYASWVDDESKWCAWSNELVVTFATPAAGTPTRGKKK